MKDDIDVLKVLVAHHDALEAHLAGRGRLYPSEPVELWPGWDYIAAAHEPRWGMARLPHLAVLGLVSQSSGRQPTFTAQPMTELALYQAHWALLCIDPIEGQKFSTAEDSLEAYRRNIADEAVATITGVRVNHLVKHVIALQAIAPKTATKFKAKLLRQIDRNDSTILRWATAAPFESYLPVLAGHAAHAELSRLAQNFGVLLRLSFNTKGEPYNLADHLGTRGIKRHGEEISARSRRSAFLQSAAWDRTLASAEEQLAGRLRVFSNVSELELTRQDDPAIIDHPRNKKIERLRKHVLPPLSAVSSRGLDWWSYAVEGLGQIYADSREHAHAARWQPAFPKQDANIARFSFGRAAVRMIVEWTAFHHPKAMPHVLGKLSNQPTMFEVERSVWEHMLSDAEWLGDGLKARAKKLRASAPAPGERGYSARSRFHLWLDDVGDDIDAFRDAWTDGLATQSEVARLIAAKNDRSDNERIEIEKRRIAKTGSGRGVRLVKTPSSLPPVELELGFKVARDAAMMITGPGTDPMFDVIRKAMRN